MIYTVKGFGIVSKAFSLKIFQFVVIYTVKGFGIVSKAFSLKIFQFVVIHTVKGFGIVSKAEIDAFLEFSYFLCDPKNDVNVISGSSVFSKTSLNIWKFTVHILLKPGLENFEHYFARVWDECNCVVVWTFLGIAFLWDWNGKLTFSGPVATAEFSKFADILSAVLSQHHLSGF